MSLITGFWPWLIQELLVRSWLILAFPLALGEMCCLAWRSKCPSSWDWPLILGMGRKCYCDCDSLQLTQRDVQFLHQHTGSRCHQAKDQCSAPHRRGGEGHLAADPPSLILFKDEGKGKSFVAFFQVSLFLQPSGRKVYTGTRPSQTSPNRSRSPKSCQPLSSCPRQKVGQTLAMNHRQQSQKDVNIWNLAWTAKATDTLKKKVQDVSVVTWRRCWCLQRLFFPLDVITQESWATLWTANEWTLSHDNHSRSRIFLAH